MLDYMLVSEGWVRDINENNFHEEWNYVIDPQSLRWQYGDSIFVATQA